MIKESKYMAINEVLLYLGISKTTFYREFAKVLPAYVVGRRIKYKREDIDAAIKRIWTREKIL